MENIPTSNREAVIYVGVGDLFITTISLLKWGEFSFYCIRSAMGLSSLEVSIYDLVFLFLAILFHPIAYYAAIRMLKATRLETGLEEAAQRAKFWRNFAIVMFLFSFFTVPTLQFSGIDGGMFAFFSLLRAIGIIVVQLFLSKVAENTVADTPPQ